MGKRYFALLVTMVMLLAMFGGGIPVAQAAEENALEELVRQQYQDYLGSLGAPDSSAATSQMLNFAISGKGKTQHLDESDAFTVAMMNSALLQDVILTGIWDGTVYMQGRGLDFLSIAGGLSWYRSGCSQWSTLCPLEPDGSWLSEKRDMTMTYRPASNQVSLSLNSCDQTMINLVGGARLTMTMQRTAIDMETVTYRIAVTVGDSFDFNNDYSHSANGDSTDALISKFGMLLSLGLVDTFAWDCHAEFLITVPNTCSHGTEDYRWEFDGIQVVSDEDNPLCLISELKQDGTVYTPYYKLESAVQLQHDAPWVVEMRLRGGLNLYLSGTRNYENNALFLSRAGGYVDMQLPKVYYEYATSTSALHVRHNIHKYGVSYNQTYKSKDWHTYRIENRIEADGNNMVYLLIDGEELGPMENYRFEKENISEVRPGWFNGWNLVVNYFKCSNFAEGVDLDIDYIQIWENGEGNEGCSYFETTTAAPTCAEERKVVHTCSFCGASYSEGTGEAALGHSWDEGKVTTEATCTTDGVMTYVCANDSSHTKTEVIPAVGHSAVIDKAVDAGCTTDGLTEGSHCGTCGTVLAAQEIVPAVGHCWDGGVVTTRPSVNGAGVMTYTCTACGEIKTEEVPYDPQVIRLAGENRFETAFLAADRMKINLGVEKFDAVIVASGTNFADALSGSYLAAVKEAPILLACDMEWVNELVKDYIRANLNPGGIVYILGGESAVPASFEEGMEGFQLKRLAGGNRFETNLLVLEETGVGDEPILVCTGLGFADSLSASAAKLPILLVYGDKLTVGQAEFLSKSGGNGMYIIGGTGAVSGKMETVLKGYGTVERVAGNNRFETSVLIAETFFEDPASVVLAYAWDFPDGLCGGPLAVTIDAPLILTMEKYETKAAEYIQAAGITDAVVLGGEKLIPESSVQMIFQ